MAEEDIYKNKQKYEKFMAKLEEFAKPPNKKNKNGRKYYCKNKTNLKYFNILFDHFGAKDLSYVRRNRLSSTFKLICHSTKKDLSKCERKDINSIVAYMHEQYKSPKSKGDFIKDLKCIWRTLFPELDERGRQDERITPYAVRHLTAKMDKSKEKLRGDRMSLKEFEKIIEFFEDDPKIQAFLMMIFDSFGRPQELLYTKIKDYDFNDSHAIVSISEHGKEGTGNLICIDSFPFIRKWYDLHPKKHDKNSYFFLSESNYNRYKQLTNFSVNKRLKYACMKLGIKKPITCYSFKRNGITIERLRGTPDVVIQRKARWTSTKQLRVYDMSTTQDVLKMELVRKGLAKAESPELKQFEVKFKECIFCGHKNGFTAEVCGCCQRTLDRRKMQKMAEEHQILKNNKLMQRLTQLETQFEGIITK
jgi:integrase/recombinase XerD